MKITILALGSRGDVQPFIALAYGLAQSGHDAVLVTNAIFTSLVESYGLSLRPIAWDPGQSMQIQSKMAEGDWRVKLKNANKFRKLLHRIYQQVETPIWERCQDAENLIYSFLPWGFSLAEKLNIPALPVSLYPVFPTRSFPTQLMPVNLGGSFNLISHYLAEQFLELILRTPINRFREKTLHIPPIRFPKTTLGTLRQGKIPLLCNLSPSVISRPPDWPASVRMDGFWFLPEPPNWRPSSELVNFIHQEPKPVYIGFGSMHHQDQARLGGMILQSLRQTNQRAVVSKGGGNFFSNGMVPEGIFPVEDIPFYWLFPQMRGIIHHGGAGTCAVGLRSGIPEVIVPHMQEQPFWANRLYQMGVSPSPIPFTRLTSKSLSSALIEITQNHRIQERACQIGEKVRAEHGLSHTVKFIEGYFRN